MKSISKFIKKTIATSLVMTVPLIFTGKNDTYTRVGAYREKTDTVEVVAQRENFVILNLTDIQLCLTDFIFGVAKNTFATVEKLIEKVKPDLITVTGDLFWSAVTYAQVERIVNFIDSFGIKWAPIFGNHEGDLISTVSKSELIGLYKHAKNCLFMCGKQEVCGSGNYFVDIYKGEGEDRKLVYTLVMMDSHAGNYFFGYDKIEDNQLEWYSEKIKSLTKNNSGAKSMIFMHIPVPEFKDAADYYKNSGCDSDIGSGVINTRICCSNENSGLFDLVKELNNTDYIFAGHDHSNNFVIKYQGVTLAYCLKTGGACYARKNMNGGTSIEIKEDGKVDVKHVYI